VALVHSVVSLPFYSNTMANPETEGVPEKEPSIFGNAGRATRRKSSVVSPEILAGEIFDQRYERTQRGLKSR
jgi:amino acid transporter